MARFRPNNTGIGRMIRSGGIRADLLRRGAAVAAACEATARIGQPPDDPHPGLFKGSFVVDIQEEVDVKPQAYVGLGIRPHVYVISTDPHGISKEQGHWNEAHTKFIEGQHTMKRALDAARL